jgi:hypothetical protein
LQDVQKINTAIQKNSLKKKIALTRVHAWNSNSGETSYLFNSSHAVNKKPIAGDFRIQVQFGGYTLGKPMLS